MAEPLQLHPDRFFDPDPTVRKVARELFAEVSGLPIVSPHGHVEPKLLAEDLPFPEPAGLIVVPDHYILRMLYSQGIPFEEFRPPVEESDVGTLGLREPRKIWQLFAEGYHLFRGTPTGIWVNHTLHEVFGVRVELSGETAARIYDEISEKLASQEFRPRALFERFNIEVLATTDAASDPLVRHREIRESGWAGRVIPTFRPDLLFQIERPGWRQEMESTAALAEIRVAGYFDFIRVLEVRREFFRQMGGTATDHGVEEPYTEHLPAERAAEIFQHALDGRVAPGEERLFRAHMLMEMARMSAQDGLVMQLHAGSFRNHNGELARRFGADTGADIPVVAEYTRNLHAVLNTYGNDPRFRMIVFTLDESTYARELAPLAGHYPALLLGPARWFHDSLEGMRRYRERTTETAGIHNTAGFNDDTRAFCSIPARHDLSRRVDANWLAGMVTRHIIGMHDAREMARALAYDLAKRAYRLD
jgi:glucuronate isomerase